MLLRAEDGIRGTLVDLDTNQIIPKPIWFNTATGGFSAYRVDRETGEILKNANGDFLTYTGVGRLKFIPRPPRPTPSIPDPDPPITRRVEPVRIPLLSHKCCKCSRLADWSVSDEMPLPPQLKNGRLYDRGRTVKIRWYCAWHYEAPRIVDAKGEIMKVESEAGGVRPQWHSS
jgi:hypothetical protein